MGEQLEVANKKLEIARGVIVALKADVASAQSEIGSLKSELETANNQAGDAAESAKAQIASQRCAGQARSGARRRQGRQPDLQGQLQDAAMAAMAAKVASDATIAALTQQASELDAKSQGQAEALKGLKAELWPSARP